jgi:uncharacterized protein
MTTQEKFIRLDPPGCGPVYFGIYSLDRRKSPDDGPLLLVDNREDAKKPSAGIGRIASVSFEATYDCNLACTYCYQTIDREYRAKRGGMTPATAKAYLEKYAPADRVEEVKISYLGGEPTMNMELMIWLCSYCRATYKKAKFNITTNGTRMRVKLRDAVSFPLPEADGEMTIGQWLAAEEHSILISLDGPEIVQDACRVRRNGSGTFAEVMAGLEYMTEFLPENRRPGFRATVSGQLDVCSMTDRLIFFNDLISRKLGRTVHLEPATCASRDDADHLRDLEKSYAEAADWYIEQVRAGRKPSWSDVVSKPMNWIFYKEPRRGSCGAGCGYMTCGVDGTLYACHRTHGAGVGSIESGYDACKLALWSDNRFSFQTPCSSCDLRFACGANCRASNFSETGSTSTVSPFACGVRKMRILTALKILDSLTDEQVRKVCVQRRRNRKAAKPNV